MKVVDTREEAPHTPRLDDVPHGTVVQITGELYLVLDESCRDEPVNLLLAELETGVIARYPRATPVVPIDEAEVTIS